MPRQRRPAQSVREAPHIFTPPLQAKCSSHPLHHNIDLAANRTPNGRPLVYHHFISNAMFHSPTWNAQRRPTPSPHHRDEHHSHLDDPPPNHNSHRNCALTTSTTLMLLTLICGTTPPCRSHPPHRHNTSLPHTPHWPPTAHPQLVFDLTADAVDSDDHLLGAALIRPQTQRYRMRATSSPL